MTNYELTIVVPGKTSPAKVKSIKEMLEKLVKTLGGNVVKSQEWGKIELAYKIKGNDTGIFYHYNLELEGEKAKELSPKLNLEDDIIRFLLVRKDK